MSVPPDDFGAQPGPEQAEGAAGTGSEDEAQDGPVATGPSSRGGSGASASASASAGDERTEAERQRDEYYDRLLRLQAEFDNYRKRVGRQQQEMTDHAATSLVRQLLPVLDTADLALAHGAGEEVKQVAGALFDVLAKEGLLRVAPEGQAFDPERHEAVAHEPAEGTEASGGPEVTEVLRAGYEWKGRVLRPAMVKVRG